MRKDKRFRIPERVEKPKFNAVVFYMGDISYSTYGQRLVIEKRLVNFIQNWLDYNYGIGKVEHRFFVHDMEAYEVSEENFYKVSNVGGTQAAGVFDLVSQIAFNEYDLSSTNFYAFYFGDGELFEEDTDKISCIKCQSSLAIFECDPCGCISYCKKCAMKVASGGKCKQCGKFYGGVRRNRK